MGTLGRPVSESGTLVAMDAVAHETKERASAHEFLWEALLSLEGLISIRSLLDTNPSCGARCECRTRRGGV